MGRIHAKATNILVDELDFSGVTNVVDINIDNGLADVTAFADTDAVFLEGKPTYTIDIQGMWDPASGAYDAEMFTDLTLVDRQVGIYPNEFTAGEFGYEANVNPGPQARTGNFTSAIVLNVTWQGDTPLMRSQVLTKNTGISSTNTGTAYEHGSISSTQKVVGVVRLLAAPSGSGNNNCVVTIESDTSGFSSATTRLTFTTLNQASTATHEVVEANGAITDTFWRAVVTISGAGSRSFNIMVSMGIQPQ